VERSGCGNSGEEEAESLMASVLPVTYVSRSW